MPRKKVVNGVYYDLTPEEEAEAEGGRRPVVHQCRGRGACRFRRGRARRLRQPRFGGQDDRDSAGAARGKIVNLEPWTVNDGTRVGI